MGRTYICVFQLLTYKKRSIVREFTKVYKSEARLPSKRDDTMQNRCYVHLLFAYEAFWRCYTKRSFSAPTPSILELYFSLIYEFYALLSDFSTYILSAEQDYEIEMNAY